MSHKQPTEDLQDFWAALDEGDPDGIDVFAEYPIVGAPRPAISIEPIIIGALFVLIVIGMVVWLL